MSRTGRKPVVIPAGVDVSINGAEVSVSGPKGKLACDVHSDISVAINEGVLNVTRSSDKPDHRALHGLTRALIANMVEGVTNGFKKELEINGVGYRALKQGTQLVMNLGYSHQVIMNEIPGISIDVPAPNKIVISGADKQAVGQFAAEVRSKRPPEPYHGKGIKYAAEVILRKEGKAGGKKK